MKLIIAACAVLAVAAPAFAQTGVGAPPTPGSTPGATSDQPLSDPIQQPGETERLLPDPDAGLSAPAATETQTGGATPQAAQSEEGQDELTTAQQQEALAGERVELPPPSVDIAGPGDVVPPIAHEENVAKVLGRSGRQRAD